MNIFAISDDPKECAEVLDDKRVVKMTLETAQLLSNAMHAHCDTLTPPYDLSHENHPVSKWTRATRGNYEWTLDLFRYLCHEKLRRYPDNPPHASGGFYSKFVKAYVDTPQGDRTPFINCGRYKALDVHTSYRLTLKDKWEEDCRVPTWTNREKPNFLNP